MQNFIINFKNSFEKKPNGFLQLLLLIIGLLTFIPLFIDHQFLAYDDNWYIYENKNVINFSWKSIYSIFSTPHAGQYSPIGEFFNAVIYHFFNDNAIAFKIFALFIHIGNSILVYKIFNTLFEKKKLAFFISLFFLIHPVQVEVVAWASAIYRVAVLFMLIAVALYLRYLETKKYTYIAGVLVFYILALLTKEQAVLFPLALLFVNFVKNEKLLLKRIIVENLILGFIALVYVLFTIFKVTKNEDFVKTILTTKEKLFLFSEAVINYTKNFLYPLDLSFSYPAFIEGNLNNSSLILNLFILGVLISVGILFSLKSKLFFAGLCWSIGFLSLALSFPFFSIREVYMADRYVYFAIIGMALCLYELICFVLIFIKDKQYIAYFLVGLLLLIFVSLSFKRARIFKDSKHVWQDAIKVDSLNYLAYNSLGFYFRTNDENEKALENYKNAIKINDDYYLAQSNIGKVFFERKQYDSALYHVSKALKIQPNYKTGYKNRAAIYQKTKNIDSLLLDLHKLIIFYPKNPSYIKERALTYFKLKSYKKCRNDAFQLINSLPKDHVGYYLVGHSSFLLNDLNMANDYLDKAIGLQSKNATYYYIRSVCRFKSNRFKESLIDVLKAKQMGHKVPEAYIKIVMTKANKRIK